MIFLVKIENKFADLDMNATVDFDLILEDHLQTLLFIALAPQLQIGKKK